MDRVTWWATVHGVTKSWTRLSDMTELVANLELISGALWVEVRLEGS